MANFKKKRKEKDKKKESQKKRKGEQTEMENEKRERERKEKKGFFRFSQSRSTHRELCVGIKILEFHYTPRGREFSYLEYF